MAPNVLHEYFVEAARRYPDRTAIIEPGAGDITYRELSILSDRVRDYLCGKGVQVGDRVGVYMRKSIIIKPASAAMRSVSGVSSCHVPSLT